MNWAGVNIVARTRPGRNRDTNVKKSFIKNDFPSIWDEERARRGRAGAAGKNPPFTFLFDRDDKNGNMMIQK